LAKLPQDFTDLLVELCERKAEFLLVGGWAVILYGHVRATDGMDIFVRPLIANRKAAGRLKDLADVEELERLPER